MATFLRLRPLLTLVCATAALTSALAACTATPAAPGPHIVIVTAATAEQPQPRLTPADVALLEVAAATDAGRVDLVVAGDRSSTTTLDLTARRDLGGGRSEIEHGPARDALISSAVLRVRAALAAVDARDGAPDLLGAITEASRTGPPGVMIVADGGVSTVAPLDLTVLGWDQDPAAVADDLADRGFLPDLRGWTVRFTMLGEVAGLQPELPTPQRDWLARLWTTVCHRAGATDCMIVPSAGQADSPVSTRHAPVVAVPPIQTRRLDDGTVTVTLPASRLGFTEGSAVLPADADSTLAAVIAPAKTGRFTVEVEGFVADWGSLAYQQALSQKRASAVAERLTVAGVPRDAVTAIGRGAADGPTASRTDGVFDEAKVRAAGIRRVVITLRPLE